MKISIALTTLILAAGAGLGWHDRQQLATARTNGRLLADEAAMLGISSDSAQNPARSTTHKRPDRATAAKLATAELIELTKQIELLYTPGGLNNSAINTLHLRIVESLSALEPAELIAILAETGTHPDLTPSARYILGSSCTTVLTNDHPQAALAIFTSSPELFKDGDGGMTLVCTALACWAKDDPMAALDWLREHPQHAPDYAKYGMLSAVAEQDP
ncbi:MAG: hypothetical protein RLZZ522_685, partial [Verrucomicrobiota bacterium]